MSWEIGLYLSEAFAELTARQGDGESLRTRWYLPSLPLSKGMNQFYQTHKIEKASLIRVQSGMASRILTRRLGIPPAILVTAGFENWLEMSTPVHSSFFTVQPQRPQSPFNRDLVFGVSERSNPEGQIEREANLADLEFLVSKLELNQIRTIALGFLHANKNPGNEEKAAEFFRKKGFQVFTSHHLSNGVNLHERHRWWHAILNAYMWQTYQEYRSSVEEDLQGFAEEINFLPPTTHGERHEDSRISHIFSPLELMAESKLKEQNICYLGLEEFSVIDRKAPRETIWPSLFGPVYMQHPRHKRLTRQPTQVIESNFWGSGQLSEREVGFEPGPMVLGRGLQPTFLDLLVQQELLGSVHGFKSNNMDPRVQARLRESLSTLSRSWENQFSHEELSQSLLSISFMEMAMEIEGFCPQNEILCVGPLAKALTPKLNRCLPRPRLKHQPNTDVFLSSQLLESN